MTRVPSSILAASLVLCTALPAQEDVVRVGDVDIHYELVGEGPPLVLIHGWTHDLRTWDLQLSELASQFTVLRYDRRGWGESGGHPDVSMDPVDLDRLMDALGLEAAHVLGHSQGGHVALRFAQTHPERVTALGLYGAPPPDGFGLAWTGPDAFPPDMGEIARDHGLDSVRTILFDHRLARGFEEGMPGAELADRLWEANGGKDLLEPEPPSGATPPPDVGRLPEMDVPTLVLTGEWEMPYFQVAADAMAYGIAGAERIVVPGGGHAVHMQEPERFTAEVVRFFRGVGRR